MVLNHFEYFLIYVYTVSSCVSISVILWLVGVSISIASSVVGLNTYAITRGIRRYNWIIKKE